MGILSTDQFQDFINTLVKAYPMRVQFDQMLTTRLGKNLDSLATTGAFESDIFYVIQNAEAQGWTYKLINAVRESRPGNPKVIEFAQQFNLVSSSQGGIELERIISVSNGFLDVAAWRAALGEAEMRVCRVELPMSNGAISYGTGFLVAESTVITNYHVVEAIFNQTAKAQDLILRFDYKRLEDGTTLNPGTEYRLEDNWCSAWSRYSQADLRDARAGTLPGEDELDFALLTVKGKPANDRAGKVMEADAPRRGFFKSPDPPIKVQAGDAILILQHPQGDYLKLAIDTNAALATNANETRLRYTTNTLRGSSGSPCFNVNWELVALHHAGDPNYSSLHRPEYNQGIPFGAIRWFLKAKGLENILGA